MANYWSLQDLVILGFQTRLFNKDQKLDGPGRLIETFLKKFRPDHLLE